MQGLSDLEVQLQQKKFGKNSLSATDSREWLRIVRSIVVEPMFLLLTVACLTYFLLGEPTEGFMMMAAIVIVTAISLFQEFKSTKAIEALRQLTQPTVRVIRNGVKTEIAVADLVPGDLILLEEGNKVPADAEVTE